jgi:coronin-7
VQYVSKFENYGKVEPNCSLINGHKAAVNDIAFSPFHSGILATAGSDCIIKCWQLPEDASTCGPLPSLQESDAISSLKTHRNSVRTVSFHPTVSHLLASTSQDMSVKLFDISAQSEVCSVALNVSEAAAPSNLSFSLDGSMFCVGCKDRIIRIFDARAGQKTLSTPESSVLGRNLQVLQADKVTVFCCSL